MYKLKINIKKIIHYNILNHNIKFNNNMKTIQKLYDEFRIENDILWSQII